MNKRFLAALGAVLTCLALLGTAGCASPGSAAPAADLRGPTSVELSKSLVPGINLGNTMEAIPNETAWGQPVPTRSLMVAYKAAGFNSVRIPLAWSQYADPDGSNIRREWMAHVKQVVDYALDAGLYVMINVHWDGGWMDHPTYDKKAEINAKLAKLWVQIAGTFRDYGDRLLFAGSNEVGMANTSGKPKPEWAEVQNSFNQTFVDTVRASGGHNATRHLVVQGYFTNIDNTVAINTVPKDSVPNRLFMEVHYYDPYNFTLNGKSSVWQWGRLATDPAPNEAWANEPWADAQFQLMKTHFIDKGVGVIVGEYGAYVKPQYPGMAVQRRYWAEYVTRSIVQHGAVPMWWDTGELIDRHTGAQKLPDVIAAIVEAADAKAASLVARMSTDEKIAQLLNVAPAIPRLGLPAYNWWTESLHGAIGPRPTTNFPEPIGLAATFDPGLVKEVASAISLEVRALHGLGAVGLDTWAPNINIFRDPRWGRGQETYGEDPYLTATLGRAFITGLQGPDPERPQVIATPKHFAVHSGPESTRHTANVIVTPHDLEDTYLPAFRAAIVEAKAGSVMCAYNRVDGLPACASGPLLKDTLRGAWGFKGYVVSDCDAVTDIDERHKFAPDGATAVAAALKAGVDNECSTGVWSKGPALLQRYHDALSRGLISEADIDTALVRLFSARLRTGALDGPKAAVPETALGAPAHQALALKSAVRSLVLLKNDGTLPLQRGVRIALVGPLADATRVLRGNYSSERTVAAVSVLDGLRQAMPQARITHVPFTASITDGDPVPPGAFVTPDGRPGLLASYYNAAADGRYEDQPVATRVETHVVSNASLLPQVGGRHKVVWTGFLVAPESGTYRLGLSALKGSVATGGAGVRADAYSPWGAPPQLTDVVLQKGHRYAVRLETEPGVGPSPGLLWKRVSTNLDAELKAAVAQADVVVAAVGLTSDIEGEEMPIAVDGFSGGDRTSIELPADQRRLLESAKALGKPVVVVLMNGGAMGLAWAKANAAAIVEAWYPGQAGGLAIGQVLAGQADPGGRLPLTFYRSVADLPPFDDYSMKGRTYRYFEGTPVYPFGFGLSYARFAFSGLRVQPAAGGADAGLRVSVTVRNTSARAGDEVAQLYITPPGFDGAPRHALRSVQRVTLRPGEARSLSFELSPRDLSFVNAAGERRLIPGSYTVSVGAGQPGSGAAALSAAFALHSNTRLPE